MRRKPSYATIRLKLNCHAYQPTGTLTWWLCLIVAVRTCPRKMWEVLVTSPNPSSKTCMLRMAVPQHMACQRCHQSLRVTQIVSASIWINLEAFFKSQRLLSTLRLTGSPNPLREETRPKNFSLMCRKPQIQMFTIKWPPHPWNPKKSHCLAKPWKINFRRKWPWLKSKKK